MSIDLLRCSAAQISVHLPAEAMYIRQSGIGGMQAMALTKFDKIEAMVAETSWTRAFSVRGDKNDGGVAE